MGQFAGKLIEDCGLRGFRVGGAAISEKHCGFVVNLGNATCADVGSLTEQVRQIVLEKTGHTSETQALLELLRPYGVHQFARTGLVAIIKGKDYLLDECPGIAEFRKEQEASRKEQETK